MRKFMMSLMIVSTALVAAPAAAQHHRGNQGQDIHARLNNMENRIERAIDRRTVSRREGNGLLRQVDQIDNLFDRYRRNGLSQREHHDLQRRLNALQQRLRFERQDNDNRRR